MSAGYGWSCVPASIEILASERHGEAQKRKILQRCRPLRSAGRRVRDELAEIAHFCEAPRRTRLTTEGEAVERVFVLASGRVRVERRAEGERRLHLGQLGAGDFVGEIAFGQGGVATETAQVTEVALALTMTTSDLRELAARNVDVHYALCAIVFERLSAAESRVESLLSAGVEALRALAEAR